MSTTPTSSVTAPARPRNSLLTYLVRFQSLLGLVLVVSAGIMFSPRRHGHILFLAPDNIANRSHDSARYRCSVRPN